MKCPKCGKDDDKVLDSRAAREGAAIRRRRECCVCGYRFTTYEEIDRDEVVVVNAKLEGGEVGADKIAQLVMDELHRTDEVAYIRFASVYRQFTDVAQFLQAITEIVKK